jgi:hypothetical protein
MIVIDAGKVRLGIVLDELIIKLGDPPENVNEILKTMLKKSKDGLEAFKKESMNNVMAAVKSHGERMKDIDMDNAPNKQLAEIIALIHQLISTALESQISSGEDPVRIVRYMSIVGAIFNSYNGDHCQYFHEIGQIIANNDVQPCADVSNTTNEPFHLEWQAIHRITSILHSMQ